MLTFFTELLAAETIASFLAQYAAEKSLDRGLDALKKEDSLESLFAQVLSTALSKTCDHFGWEYSEESAFEQFSVSWRNVGELSKSITADDVKAILVSTLGSETVDVNETEELYWFFLHSFYDTLCGQGYDKLWKYIEICQLNELSGQKTVGKRPKTTKDIDVYKELVATFDRLFKSPRSEENDFHNLKDYVNSLSPQERVDFEDELNLLYYQAAPISVEGEIGDLSPVPEEYKGYKKRFSIHNPPYIDTLIYQIDRKAIPFEHRYMYWVSRLDYTIEILKDGSLKCTYYVDNPADDGNHLIILNINQKTGSVYVNGGFLDYDHVKISRRPTRIRGKRPSEFLEKEVSSDDNGLKEYSWSSSSLRQFIIIDTDIGEELTPEYRLEGSEIKASIWMVPYKKYITFEIRPTAENDCKLSDYDIGCAYRDGTYMLKQDTEMATYYFRIAKAAGNERAAEELEKLGYKSLLERLEDEAE